jgi:hypothetical protein
MDRFHPYSTIAASWLPRVLDRLRFQLENNKKPSPLQSALVARIWKRQSSSKKLALETRAKTKKRIFGTVPCYE